MQSRSIRRSGQPTCAIASSNDLIRGGHYGPRSCEPHLQAEHMAALTQACVRVLANPELPRTCATARPQLAKADTTFQGASVGQPTEPCLSRMGLVRWQCGLL